MKSQYKRILYLGNILSKQGKTPTTIETLGPKLEAEGFEIVYASDKKGEWARLFDMLNAIRRNRSKIDAVLIDSYSTKAFYYAYLSARLCKLFRIPYIPILHGGDFPIRIEKSPDLCDFYFRNSFTNVAISGYLKGMLDEKGYKNEIIPNNIDLENYPYTARESAKPKLLWVRAFHEIYNPTMAIYVVNELREHYPDVLLTMVGPDKDGSLGKCQQLSKELGLERNVIFTGKLTRSDWGLLSASHDIFINTTNFDNLPVSVIEAMALGLPVISTNVGGLPYLVDDERNGLLVAKGDNAGMAKAILSLLRNGDLVGRLSSNAHETAKAYDWQVVKLKWSRLINSLN